MSSDAERIARLETTIEYIQKRLDSLANHLTDNTAAVFGLKETMIKHDIYWKILSPLASAFAAVIAVEGIKYIVLASQVVV